jgi:hypothetical protein
MITVAVDAETKERVRAYATSAGVDLSTYVTAAIAAAMERDERVARAFAPLDALIDEAETGRGGAGGHPGEGAQGSKGQGSAISQREGEELDQALDDFFDRPQRRQGVA